MGIRKKSKNKCTQCKTSNKQIIITFGGPIRRFGNRTSMPKHCKGCLQEQCSLQDPYEGLYECFYTYPATKGHRYTVHGRYLTEE